MTRGGYREKAGRKTSWVSGCKFADTKIVRVPAVIAAQVLEIAHKLDAGEEIAEGEQTEKLRQEVLKLKAVIEVQSKQIKELEELVPF
jgi:hypothetical protein